MTEFLLVTLSGKDRSREGYGRAAGLLGIISNIIISLLKLIVGILGGSIAIIADAANSLSDAASSVVTMVGFHLSGKPADKEHPYGHARMEYIAGLTVSFVVIFIGIQLAFESFKKIIQPEATGLSFIAVAVMLFSILIKLWQIYIYRLVGKKINSSTLMATAADSRNDIIAGLTVLISIPLSKLTGFSLDGYAGFAVAIFIIVSGIGFVKETSAPLLGAPPDEKLILAITERIMSSEGVLGVHDLIVHSYGEGTVFASAHVEMSADNDLLYSHEVIDEIEFTVHEQYDVNLTLHLDPVVSDERVEALRDIVEGLSREISSELKMHDFRAVFTPENIKIKFDLTLPIKPKLIAKEVRRELTDKITEKVENCKVVIIIEQHYTDVHKRNFL